MGKRFTATEKWDDPWFRKLPCKYKALWQFVCDKCDNAGVWKKDFESAIHYIGELVDEKTGLELFNSGKERIRLINGDSWFITEFVVFQFGELSVDCRPHKSVMDLIAKHQKKGYPKGMDRVSATLKDKDKEQDIDKDKDNGGSLEAKYIALWNEKMPWKVNNLSGVRHKHLKERLKEPAFVDNFPVILDKILASDFLTGRKPSEGHESFRGDFDWITTNDHNYTKILEGKYDNRETVKTGLAKSEVRK